ncbi:hypothetical protein QNM99_18910 [Pseudomonas sp. PCH446]
MSHTGFLLARLLNRAFVLKTERVFQSPCMLGASIWQTYGLRIRKAGGAGGVHEVSAIDRIKQKTETLFQCALGDAMTTHAAAMVWLPVL